MAGPWRSSAGLGPTAVVVRVVDDQVTPQSLWAGTNYDVRQQISDKIARVIARKAAACTGAWLDDTDKTLTAMWLRPFELHLELTNICNASCVFCPYPYQHRPAGCMGDEVFGKAVGDFVRIQGGSIGLTPIVGDALIIVEVLDRVRYLRSLPGDRPHLRHHQRDILNSIIKEVLTSGLTTINVSTAGFDKESYRRITGRRLTSG